MAKKVVAFEVIGGKNAIIGVFHGGELFELIAEFFFKEVEGSVFIKFISLEEMEEVAFFFDELEMAIDLQQLFVRFLWQKVIDGIMDEGLGKLFH